MRIWVAFVAIFVVEVSSDAFFLRNNQQTAKRESLPQYSAAPIEIDDGYGSPAAPLITVTTKVKKSIPLKTSYSASPIDIDDGYGSPAAPVLSGSYSAPKVKKAIPLKTSYSATPIEIDDGYGSPAAPVLSEYNEPQSYSSPVKVKKSIPLPIKNEVEVDIDDGYGSPSAPVISVSNAPSVKPVYYRRPPRHNQVKKYRRPKKMFSFLDYMPMMNFLMMGSMSQRKPKRQITYQSQKARHIRKPATFQVPKFRMPKFRMPKGIPKPIKYPASFALSSKKPIITNTVQPDFYSPSKKPKLQKLEYSGWQPIGFNYNSPIAPVEAEPEIITIDNAYRHPKKYEVPALPTGTYAPEPITAKPASEFAKSEEETDDNTAIVYGVPEIAIEVPKTTYFTQDLPKVKKSISQSALQENAIESTTDSNAFTIKELPRATYPSEEPPAPIEEPLFNSAPVQDLTSLAEFDMYEIHTTSTSKPKSVSSKVPDHVYYRDHEGYGILYQNTHDSNHLAEEVQSGSVYVQKPQIESETEITPEDDEDLYYIFYDKNKPRQNQVKTTSSPGSASTASFNIHVDGQSHGFSHNLDHIG